MVTIEQIIKELEEIPPLPQAALELLELTSDIHANAGKATAILSRDPALSMKVLKSANSCKYGYARHIGTVSQAVVILGFKGLRSLILGLAIYKFLGKKDDQYSKQLWKHLLTTACLSKMITSKLGQEDPELGFLCGLIHDIGKAVLNNNESELYSELIERSRIEHIPLHEIESSYFGFTHADLGREICRSWYLPEILVRTVALHHNKFFTKVEDEGEVQNELLQTVVVADNLAKLYSVSDCQAITIVPKVLHLFEKRGISQSFLEECFQAMPEEISKLQDTFPDVFTANPLVNLKASVQMKDKLQGEIMRLFLIGKGFEIVDSPDDVSVFVSDDESQSDIKNFILCDFFSNDTHYNTKVMFTNRLHEWLETLKVQAV